MCPSASTQCTPGTLCPRMSALVPPGLKKNRSGPNCGALLTIPLQASRGYFVLCRSGAPRGIEVTLLDQHRRDGPCQPCSRRQGPVLPAYMEEKSLYHPGLRAGVRTCQLTDCVTKGISQILQSERTEKQRVSSRFRVSQCLPTEGEDREGGPGESRSITRL